MNKQRKVLITTTYNEMGIIIDSVVYEKEGGNYFLRIVIDSDKIIDIDTCVEVTKVINPLLDEVDIMMSLVKEIKETYGIQIREVDLGGGVGVYYTKNDQPKTIQKFCEDMIEKIEKVSLSGVFGEGFLLFIL